MTSKENNPLVTSKENSPLIFNLKQCLKVLGWAMVVSAGIGTIVLIWPAILFLAVILVIMWAMFGDEAH